MASQGVWQLLNQLYRRLLFLPEQASSQALGIDLLHYAEITVTTAVTALLAVAALFFARRWRRRPGREVGDRVRAPRWLELSLYGTLLAVFLLFWAIGFRQYLAMATPPRDALEVYVTGKQWMWKFGYPQGVGSAGVLVVPAGRPVRLLLTSRDVIHSFYVPAFRLKRDAVPGLYTDTWFLAPEPGRHPILCAEMCGTGHARMLGEVLVLAPEAWDAWLRDQPRPQDRAGGAADLVDLGMRVAARHGCFGCHSPSGAEYIAPTWRGAFGARVRLEGGETVRVDEAYLTESMMDPGARIVAGFAPLMPSYRGLLDPGEVAALVEYIKSLAGPPGGEAPRSHER